MDVSCLLKYDPSGAKSRRIDGEIFELGQLFDLFRLGIVRKQVKFTIPVGKEIYPVADPHGPPVIAHACRLRDLFNSQC